jgi:ribonuclease HIII
MAINDIILIMVTVKVDEETLKKVEEDYKDNIVTRNIGYIMFVIKTESNIITAFNNKKGMSFKITIQGDNATEIAKKYAKSALLIPKKEKKVKESPYFIDVDSQIGSDEVGTGDFLGPIVVCAAYCDHETMKLISKYDIKDSKKLNDEKILEVVPLLLKKVHYEYKILTNDRYNDAVKKGFNMVKIKCILHNFVLTKLHERCPYVQNVYIDQFTPEKNYYAYLNDIEHITDGVVFREKGESYFPSVALASCIARYYFLMDMDFASKKINMRIPLGAGDQVNVFAKKYIEKFGLDAFSKLAKQNFKNYEEVTSTKLI